MSEHSKVEVPYIVHEGEVFRLERIIKRLVIALSVAVLAVVATDVAWIITSMF